MLKKCASSLNPPWNSSKFLVLKIKKIRYRQLIVYWLRWFFDILGGRSVRFSVASEIQLSIHFRFDYFHNYFNYFHSTRQLSLKHGWSAQINNYYHGNFLHYSWALSFCFLEEFQKIIKILKIQFAVYTTCFWF